MDWHPRDRKLRLDPSAADIFSSLSSKIQYQEKDLDQFPPPQLIFLEVISGSIFQKNLSCPHFLGVLGFHFFGKFDRKLSSRKKSWREAALEGECVYYLLDRRPSSGIIQGADPSTGDREQCTHPAAHLFSTGPLSPHAFTLSLFVRL